jgi:ubiquinone/menaquinone biosynthesis C-methylase UbiE
MEDNSRDYSSSWDKTYGTDKDPIRNIIIFPFIKSKIENLRHQFIADVGCGNGNMILNIQNLSFDSLIGIEKNPSFVKYAKENVTDERVNIIESDFLKESLISAGSIDILLAIFVVNEMEELSEFFRKSSRILTPTGQILLIMTHPFIPLYWKILSDTRVSENNKIKGFSDYFSSSKCEYTFSLSGDVSDYWHHNLENMVAAIRGADLFIYEMREFTTSDQRFEAYAEYWRTRDIPKYLYLRIGR